MGQPRLADHRGLFALNALLLALACTFSPADANRAAGEGAAMARTHAPYTVRPWVLWDARDPLRAVHGRADLDAVIVETPYERLRYEAYLQMLQDLPLTNALVERWRRAAQDRFGFVVYGHSRGGGDRDKTFLRRFSPATVLLGDGRRTASTERVPFGPDADFYSVGTFREERYAGSVTYRFAAPPDACRPAGVLTFTDADGRRYRFAFDLARYR
ncbi:MAG: hypothetical protein JO164_00375 [Candidatus Eremiobacteraeota bacterium]|nr:hypothetical protein [Candidatus Eremiobacteraeota bacterium]